MGVLYHSPSLATKRRKALASPAPCREGEAVHNGNALAALALLLVLPFAAALFAQFRATVATAWLITIGLYLLPEGYYYQLPIFPDMGKSRIVILCCGIAQLVTAGREYRDAKLMRGREWLFLFSLPLATTATILANMDMVPGVAGAMTPMDIPAETLVNVLDVTGVFLLGRMVFRTTEDAVVLIRALASCAVLYLPLIVLEMFKGPVCHQWLYGYLQHDFSQAARGTGFRPMVFMSHGLTLAMVLYITTAGTIVLARSTRMRILGMPASAVAVLFLCLFPLLRSSAALIYTVLTAAALLLLKPKTQIKLASWLLIVAWLYVPARMLNWIPVWNITALIAKFSPDRAGSLGFRFAMENQLVGRALERPILGWGGWGRNLTQGAVPDGAWIIYLGGGGATRLLIIFGLLGLPILLARRRIARASPDAQVILAGFSLILAFCIVDLLPNGMGSYMQCFLPGAVAGLAWGLPEQKNDRGSHIHALLGWYLAKKRRALPAGS